MIQVTKPFLPPFEEYQQYIQDVWSRNWLTNNGPLVNELELKLKRYLGLKHLLFLSNGTIAIQIAIKALDLKGEILTTPFSYVATTSSIVWEQCKPVFVDIDKTTFNIDAEKLEAAITPNTSAILATHVFGNPCAIDKIEAIATKHGLKVIYDAAHSFGVEFNNESVFSFGDISTTSFHATKLFHTIEGGAVFTTDPKILKQMVFLRNFGHNGPENFESVGINAKNSEMHAAMGLCNLNYIEQILNKRKEQYHHYKDLLQGKGLQFQKIEGETNKYNYAYFPMVFENEAQLLKIKNALEMQRISPRRYFYPSLNTLNYIEQQEMPISERISKRILCLPVYHTMSKEVQDLIIRIVIRTLKY